MATALAGGWATIRERIKTIKQGINPRASTEESTASRSLAEEIQSLVWPDDQLQFALQAIARYKRWGRAESVLTPLQHESLATTAERLDIDLEATSIPYTQIALFTRHVRTALIFVHVDEVEGWLAIVGGGRRRLTLIAADGTVQKVARGQIEAAIGYALTEPWQAQVAQTLTELGIKPARRAAVGRTLLRKQLAEASIERCWQLHVAPGGNIWHLIQEARLPALFGLLTLSQAILTLLTYGAAFSIGLMSTSGVMEGVWIFLIMLILALRIPVQLVNVWISKIYNVALELMVKARLMYGLLRLQPHETEGIGTGEFLAWNIQGKELSNVGLSISNLLRAVVAVPIAAAALAFIAGPLILVFMTGWLLLTAGSFWLLCELRYRFESYHAKMTNDILERMQGHQTRLMQELDWYGADDQALVTYLALRRRYDRFEAVFEESLRGTWLLASIGSLAIPFIEQSTPLLGAGFAVVLFANLEFVTLAQGLIQFSQAVVAWRLGGLIEYAARRFDTEGDVDVTLPPRKADARLGQRLLSAQNLGFSYPASERMILKKLNLRVQTGDRLLLEGPSGGGKSTFALVLSGYYNPQNGILFLRGLDQETLGAQRWRQQVVYVPQFHQNHIISATLAFNLLMGRRWPAQPADLEEAEQVCRALGLGRVLDQMPLGLQQRVGERGWHLSHGERSRVYIARALLQQADLIVLDESFASLDPENMAIALRTVLEHAPTLLVIAHP